MGGTLWPKFADNDDKLKFNPDVLGRGLNFKKVNELGLNAIVSYCYSLHENYGINSTPIYDSLESRDNEYKQGSKEILVASIDNLKVVDEDSLSWDQVMQFREDKVARSKYRRLMHWLDKEMIGKTQSFIEDEIFEKLEEYEDSLKKHGIRTLIGFLSRMLDPKAITSASAAVGSLSLAGDPFWGKVLGLGLLIGQAAFSVTKKGTDHDDTKRGKNPEIAYVYEMKKKLGE